jgi:sulfate permease, SulP family
LTFISKKIKTLGRNLWIYLSMVQKYANTLLEYLPKSFTCWKEGYSKTLFLNDLFAGITVGIIALPLAMAFAIGSGVSPERGLYTAIIAGFLISFLGGSRVQIGGPTGAFVVIVFDIIQRHQYEGLVIATLIAGVLLILMGVARLGLFLKFIPYSVTIGFTTGIALNIFSFQIKDFLGLSIPHLPPDFFGRWQAIFQNVWGCCPYSMSIAAGSLLLIFLLKATVPRLPGAIVSLGLATFIVWFFALPVATISTQFGEIPRAFPSPTIPNFSWMQIQQLFPDAITIALLAGIESLLSALVADGMTGYRHRSNCELVAQGFANIASVIFGGIPATGAISRTSANINMGAKTPLAGMIHAITLLLLILLFAPIASKAPLPALAAVLIFVAWNMAELDHVYAILKGPFTDALVMLITFFLTVLLDLNVAVQVGVILSAFIFIKRMSDSTTIEACKFIANEPQIEDSETFFREEVPDDTKIFEINGPFFYGVSDLLQEVWKQQTEIPKVVILHMQKVPLIDASGIEALKKFYFKCRQKGTLLLIAEARTSVQKHLKKSGVETLIGKEHFFDSVVKAIKRNRQITSGLPLNKLLENS